MMIPQLITTIHELPKIIDGKLPEWVQTVPIGRWWDFRNNHSINLDRATVAAIHTRHAGYKSELMVDWEHAYAWALASGADLETLRKAAHAAMWLDRHELREDGMWSHVGSWTAAGAADVRAGRFRYLSPVIHWHKAHKVTGVRGPEIFNLALTNDPLLDGILPLVASAYAGVGGFPTNNNGNERNDVMKEKVLLWLKARGVALAAEADDATIASAFDAEIAKLGKTETPAVPAEIVAAIGGEVPTIASAVERITALKKPAVPADLLAAFGRQAMDWAEVPSEIAKLRGQASQADQVSVMSARLADFEKRDRDRLLDAAIKDGRVTPAMRDTYAALLASTDPAVRSHTEVLIASAKATGPLAPSLGSDGARPEDAASTSARDYVRKLMGRG